LTLDHTDTFVVFFSQGFRPRWRRWRKFLCWVKFHPPLQYVDPGRPSTILGLSPPLEMRRSLYSQWPLYLLFLGNAFCPPYRSSCENSRSQFESWSLRVRPSFPPKGIAFMNFSLCTDAHSFSLASNCRYLSLNRCFLSLLPRLNFSDRVKRRGFTRVLHKVFLLPNWRTSISFANSPNADGLPDASTSLPFS